MSANDSNEKSEDQRSVKEIRDQKDRGQRAEIGDQRSDTREKVNRYSENGNRAKKMINEQ